MKKSEGGLLSLVNVATLVLLLVSFITGCGGTVEEDEALQTTTSALTSDVMGFESPASWTASSGTVQSAASHTQGAAALALKAPVNYTTLRSASIASSAPALAGLGAAGSFLAVDVMLPAQQPNPAYFGALQLYVNCPSRNLHNQFLGQVELTGLPVGAFGTLTFGVSSFVRSALAGASFSDLTFTLALNAPAGATGTYGFDNLRVLAAANSEFALTANPPALTLARGSSTTETIAITRSIALPPGVSFVTPGVSLSVSGLPSGVTASFNPSNATGTSSTLTLSASTTAALGNATLVVTGSAGGITRTVSFALTLLVALPEPVIDWTMAPQYPGFQALPAAPPPQACTLPPELVGQPGFLIAPCTVGGAPGCRLIFQNQAGTINGQCMASPSQSSSCQLACGTPGIKVKGVCVGVEFCNGKDDDCDGVIDNGGVCQVPHSLLSVGVKPQYQTPLPEVEAIQCVLPPALVGIPGFFVLPCEIDGTPACRAFFTNQAGTLPATDCAPPPCTSGATASCHLSCGAIGTHACGADGHWAPCQGVERCNGKDDDCDSATDEGGVCQLSLAPDVVLPPPPAVDPPPPPPPPVTCTLPPNLVGQPGFFVLSCGPIDGLPACQVFFTNQAGTLPAGPCAPPPCQTGITASCTLGCGGAGTRTCNADHTWSTCNGACSVGVGWDTELNACGSTSPGNPITQYTWSVDLHDRVVDFTTMSCRSDFVFPAEDTYAVKLTVTGQDGRSAMKPGNIVVKNHVVVSLGDSVASGEGNPDVSLSSGGGAATWVNRRCHRSLRSGHALVSRDIETLDPHTSVTFLSLACSGAKITTGLLDLYGGQEPDGALEPPQIATTKAIMAPHDRQIDALLLQIGANDLGFGELVAECAVPPFARPSNSDILEAALTGEPTLPLLVFPEGTDLTSCATSNNIGFIHGILDGLLGPPDVNLPGLFDGLHTAILDELNVTPQHVYLADYPDPTRTGNNFCGEIRFNGAVADEAVSLIPSTSSTFLDDGIDFAVVTAMTFMQPSLADGVVTSAEVVFAHDQVVVPLNNLVGAAANKFNWTHVSGLNGITEFGSHGYCLPGNLRWFRSYDESKVVQGNIAGSLHPNANGHDAYRRLLRTILVQDLNN